MPPINVTATISKDGIITVGPIDPEHYKTHRESILRMMSAVGSTVVETECLAPNEADGIVNRLVALLKGGPS